MTTPPTAASPPVPAQPGGIAFRLAWFYGAIFFVFGVYLPFWPVWLAAQGLSDPEIGLLMATGPWIAVLASPLAGRLADRLGRRRPILIGLSLLLAAAYAAMFGLQGFWAILAAMCVAGLAQSPLSPLTDSLTLFAQARGLADYGRVRLWGSFSFIVASLVVGRLLSTLPEATILWVIVIGAGFMVLVALAVPEIRPDGPRAGPGPFAALLGNRVFLVFLGVAVVLMASHAVYYAVGSLHWRRAGVDPTVIGLLWAEGVVAEIVLFAYGRRALARFSPVGLLMVCAAAGLIRWPALAATTEVGWLVLIQALHGLTFGAAHLGGMAFIGRAVPETYSGTAQGLYTAVVAGLGLGSMLAVSGALYQAAGANAFLAMALLSGAGLVGALVLYRIWDGGTLAVNRPRQSP